MNKNKVIQPFALTVEIGGVSFQNILSDHSHALNDDKYPKATLNSTHVP